LFKEISLHILDLAENCVTSGAKNINIKIIENTKDNRLQFEIIDDGKGMNKNEIEQAIDPFFTTRTTRRVGLGLPFLKEATEACNGSFDIQSEPGKGTRVIAKFQRDHIDRMPIGDIQSTILNLLVGYPDIHWCFEYKLDNKQFVLDNNEIIKELNGISFSDPMIIRFLRTTIENGIKVIHKQK